MQKSSKLLWLFVPFCGLSSHISAQSLYDENTVQSIQVYMSQSNWDQLLDNEYATTGDYIMADSVSVNGTVFDSVGVKYKGNSSYKANQVKNPWHIELDTYKDQDYQGYKDIKLANVDGNGGITFRMSSTGSANFFADVAAKNAFKNVPCYV